MEVSASVRTSPAQIALVWKASTVAGDYTIYRRTTGPNTSWGSAVATLPRTATSWVDSAVQEGIEYEYRLVRPGANGYLRAGIRIPLKDDWGKVIFLVDASLAEPMRPELDQMQRLMVADGWQVVRHEVSRTAAVPAVKALIKSLYDQDPARTRALYLFGHLPVPYSGAIMPDGHSEHKGAWPADVFYADLDGTWTDSTVTITSASHGEEPTRNHNIPGDGKYDQNYAPSPLELEVGRVDLANLPKLTPLGTEVELLRNYVRKNHRFRHKQFAPERRALVYGREFDWKPFRPATDVHRDASAFFGQGALTVLESYEFLPTLQTQTYLWAHGDGGGHFQGAKGVGTTSYFVKVATSTLFDYGVTYDPQAAFFTTFGSWFGDWDTEDNFLRAFLAVPTGGLTNIWAGGNHWFAQDLALGYNLGRPARLLHANVNSADRGYTLEFTDASFSRNERVHMTLMGDPTLRVFVVGPPGHVDLRPAGRLTWSAAADTAIVGYHVYWAAEELGPYLRLTTDPVTTCSFEDSAAKLDGWYMVRAIKLETTGSGTFFNPSVGIMVPAAPVPTPAHDYDPAGNLLLRWRGAPDRHDRIEASDDLASWAPLPGEFTGADAALAAIVQPAHEPPGARKFWRLVSAQNGFFSLAYPATPAFVAGTSIEPLAPVLEFVDPRSPVGYAVVSGSFPLGLSLNAQTGAIEGTPTGLGARSATVRATNGTLTAETVVRLVVLAAAP